MPMGSAAPTDPLLRAATEDIIRAARAGDALGSIQAVLLDCTRRFHALGRLVHEEDDDEVLLHASPGLTIYHITLSPGVQYPPHNHRVDALVGIYRGGETNYLYPVAGDELAPPQMQDIAAAAVVHMAPDTVHSVANTGQARSGALHVYLGDLPRTRRQMWSLDSLRVEPFDNDRYLAGARPVRRSASD